MRYILIITLLMLSLFMTGCAKKGKQESIDSQCQRLIEKARELHAQEAKSRDKVLAEQVANLITAAKIDQEHKDFAQCIDKSTRAIKLLDNDAQLSLGNKN